jgi:hypothetical protein
MTPRKGFWFMGNNEQGRPYWLSAYPNEGTLDYFGGRFYRQPNRKYLVRGAAANDFKNPKTLLFYGALSFSFRKLNNLEIDSHLAGSDLEAWKRWFKNANFLYVVNYYAKHGEVPDRGFTGAIEAYKNYFLPFCEGKQSSFKIETVYDAFYPTQRQWGYLTQFWRPPLHYFRSVLSIETCLPGEYAKDCFELLSSYQGWDTFIEIIDSGQLTFNELEKIQDVLDCKKLTGSEKSLAQKLILDEDSVSGNEFVHYKNSLKIYSDLLHLGVEGFKPTSKDEFASIFTYKHLRNEETDLEQNYWWQILVSSLAFEIGINRMYSMLGELAEGEILKIGAIDNEVTSRLEEWKSTNSFKGLTLKQISEEWQEANLSSFSNFNQFYTSLLDYENIDTFFDGLLVGYLISKVKLPQKIINSESYGVITDNYHYFIPQSFYSSKLDENQLFSDFIAKVVIRLLDDQYDFSLTRMGLGQKAKFILIKEETTGNYIFQIDNRDFYENRGIINMIDACLHLWEGAGLLETQLWI